MMMGDLVYDVCVCVRASMSLYPLMHFLPLPCIMNGSRCLCKMSRSSFSVNTWETGDTFDLSHIVRDGFSISRSIVSTFEKLTKFPKSK